ncbi:UNVERIFIED_ORG: hypothetical protein ABIC58_001984 [Leuconostoc holzapfelii]
MSFYVFYLLQKLLIKSQELIHISIDIEILLLSLAFILSRIATVAVGFIFFYRLITFLTSRTSINWIKELFKNEKVQIAVLVAIITACIGLIK